ncbi:MAG TPA: hypothetical protein VH763_13535 [Gemmatimonadales bacterium]
MRGVTPASAIPEASADRSWEPTIRPARLLEDASLAWHPVGKAEPWLEPVAFLDGVQHAELVGYAGSCPIIIGEIAAAVRERRERRLQTIAEDRRQLAIARPSALAAAGDALDQWQTIALPEDEIAHPARDLTQAARALDRARGALELELAGRYRAVSQEWLAVDGTLTESPAWSVDPRMLGISRTHSTLPFEGSDLHRYLRLPVGHRSSIFSPESRNMAPVHAWALRLWPWEGRDLFYGLIKIEVAPVNGTPEMADLLSRKVLAERAPVSAPHARWDRLLYGVYSVGQYLGSRARNTN